MCVITFFNESFVDYDMVNIHFIQHPIFSTRFIFTGSCSPWLNATWFTTVNAQSLIFCPRVSRFRAGMHANVVEELHRSIDW